MGVPNSLTKLVISGSIAGGLERFAFSLWFSGYTAGGTAGGLDPTTLDGSTGFGAFRAAVLGLMRPEDSLDSYDAYFYTGGVAVTHEQASVAHAGTSSGSTHPPQIAVVMTLRTAVATRSGRGRIYLLASGVTIDPTTRRVSLSQVGAAVDGLAQFLRGVDASGGGTAVVVSQTHTSFSPIVSVDADQIADTQRRRRNALTSPRHVMAL